MADQPREIKIINLMGTQRVREEVGRQAISRMVYARPSLIQPQILAFVVIFTSSMHTYFKGDRRPLYFYTPGLPSPKLSSLLCPPKVLQRSWVNLRLSLRKSTRWVLLTRDENWTSTGQVVESGRLQHLQWHCFRHLPRERHVHFATSACTFRPFMLLWLIIGGWCTETTASQLRRGSRLACCSSHWPRCGDLTLHQWCMR